MQDKNKDETSKETETETSRRLPPVEDMATGDALQFLARDICLAGVSQHSINRMNTGQSHIRYLSASGMLSSKHKMGKSSEFTRADALQLFADACSEMHRISFQN